MGLRELAQSDLGKILNDGSSGFGWPIKITDPDGVVINPSGFSGDISELINPDTGQAVSGRFATIAVAMEAFVPAGVEVPRGIADASKKPWIVSFEDVLGKFHEFKIAESNPDRTLGLLTCKLEAYSR